MLMYHVYMRLRKLVRESNSEQWDSWIKLQSQGTVHDDPSKQWSEWMDGQKRASRHLLKKLLRRQEKWLKEELRNTESSKKEADDELSPASVFACFCPPSHRTALASHPITWPGPLHPIPPHPTSYEETPPVTPGLQMDLGWDRCFM